MSAAADDLAGLDATGTAELIRRDEISAQEAVDAAIERIEARDARLNAVVIRLFESAREAAAGPLPDGPFRGVPFLLKDLDAGWKGRPLHCGMAALAEVDYRASQTSGLVAKFLEAGLVVLGKTNTPELGLTVTTEPRSYGATHNPWNGDHSTGGSSGGSAAAVASGMVPVAHASDGGGSIRIPASECGLVGLKPARGRISLGPEYGEYWAGFVTSHVLTRTLRDCAGLLDSDSGPMSGDPYQAPVPARAFREEVGAHPGRLRIGLMPRAPAGGPTCDPECVAAVEAVGRVLETLGHDVELAYPPALDEHEAMQAGFGALVSCWTAKGLAHWGAEIGRELGEEDVEPPTWLLASLGRAVSAATYLQALEDLHAWSRRMLQWWASGFDLLVTPTLASPPPRLGELSGTPEDPLAGTTRVVELTHFTTPYNITGQPALSLPLFWSPDALPIGVQLVGAAYREDLLLRVGSQLELALPWAERRAPGFGAC